jgi:uncharacterized protein YndB with AHSA1/START domain
MITKSVLLRMMPDATFKLFTEQINVWWPAERRHTNDPESTLHLYADGRFFERASDGYELELGRVIEWVAPLRIVLDFYIATGPAHPTKAEIQFAAEGGGTRVTITHTSTPESESLWDERAPRYERSWEIVLAALSIAATM